MQHRFRDIAVTSFTAFAALVCYVLFAASCSTTQRSVFAKKTPHESYADKISNSGLRNTILGHKWFSAATNSLQQPLQISLPYKETGFFGAEEPAATGLHFAVKRGAQVVINVTKKADTASVLFADLWQVINSSEPKLVASADTALQTITYEADNEASYILRLQPELLSNMEYTVTITTEPSLAFPVPAKAHPRIESFWGANRDAGARKHEGIDIFGAFRTPVVAAANGYVTGVNENHLGGKVVWLRPEGKSYTLYYAHLDSQVARTGQFVHVGDTLGLMGNTGNAKTTPTHLHFGIYTYGGAIDPLPFVNNTAEQPKNVTASTNALHQLMRTKGKAIIYAVATTNGSKLATVDANTLMRVNAATSSYYKVALADGTQGFVDEANLTATNTNIKKLRLASGEKIFSHADTTAPAKTTLQQGDAVNVLAQFKEYYFVEANGIKGWVKK